MNTISLFKALKGNNVYNIIEMSEEAITILDESKPNARMIIKREEIKVYKKCTKRRKRPRISSTKKVEIAMLNKNIAKLVKEFKSKNKSK